MRRRTGVVRRIAGASAGRRVLGVNKVALLVCFALSQVAWAQNPPGKPTITELIPKGGCFIVKWSAPASDGGSAITGYDITPQNSTTVIIETGANAREAQWPSTCFTNEALTYNMAVRASNANGDGAWSDTVNMTLALPVLTADTATNAPDVTLSITQMTNAPWYYKGTQAGATCTSVAKGTASATVSGLTVGTEYTYGAYYDSSCSQKWGQDRTLSVRFTPVAVKPPKPTNVTVTGGDASATLGWASGGDGGSQITKWQFLKKAGDDWDSTWTDICETSTDSNCPSKTSHTVSSLNNGTTYKFKVRAVNAVDDGAESDESASVTLVGSPPKPTNVTVSGGNASVTLGWTSGGNGGSAITKWQYLKEESGTWDGTWTDICETSTNSNCPSVASHTVSNLTNGTAYKFKVRAVNTHGDGAESAESTAVTPATKPPKPTNVTASSGDASVTLGWTSGGNGGSEITKWQYLKEDGGTWDNIWTDICETSSDSNCPGKTSHTVSSLTNGTAYKFKVRAVNALGDGAESDESAAVTPEGKPPKPTSVTATGGDASVTLGWSSGGNGGSAITKWQYLGKADATWDSTWTDICKTESDSNCPSKTSYTVSSLNNGTAYKFKVRAVNTHGDGAESDESASVVPAGKPSTPTKPTVAAGHQNVIISSSISSSNGSAVTKWRYTKKTGGTWDDWTEVPNSANLMSMTVTVVDLTNDTAYKFKVQAENGVGWSGESPESDAATPKASSLEVKDRTQTSATLSLAGYPGKWHYKGGEGGSGACTEVLAGTTTVALSQLKAGTSHTFTAHNASDDTCPSSTRIGSPLTFSTLDFRLSSKTDKTANLELDHWSQGEAWSYRKEHPGTGTCHNTTTTSVGLTGLEENTSYTYRAYRGSDCATGNRIAVTYFKTTPAHGLFASNVGATTAKLSLNTAGADIAWSHQKTDGPGNAWCANVAAGTNTVDLSGLTTEQSYTWAAYRDAGCDESKKIDDVRFATKKPLKPTKPTVTPGNAQVTLTSSVQTNGGPAITKWQYIKEEGGNWETDWNDISNSADTRLSTTITGLTNNTSYKFKVRAVNSVDNGTASDPSDAVTPRAAALTAGSVEHSTATLTLANHTSNWSLKRTAPADTTCKVQGTTTTESLTGLAGNTSYTYKAYSGNDCSTELAARTFLTKPAKPGKPTATAGAGSGKLTLTATLTGGSGALTKWEYTKDDGNTWTNITTDTDNNLSFVVSGLTDGTNYTFKVRATNATGTGPASDASTATAPLDETLTTGSVTHNTATLTLANHPGNWWLKRTTPADTNCKSKGTTATESLTSLAGNTSYTYKAYSDSDCSTELAARTFLTKPAKPGTPTATAGAGSGKLTLTATLTGGTGALTKWEYTKDDGTNWTDITTDTDNSLSHVVADLTDGTDYTFKVRATNATGTGPASDSSTAVAPKGPTLSAGTATADGMTLTIGNYSLAWHFKYTVPDGGSCSTNAVPAGTSTKAVTGLTSNTAHTFKAYSDSGCETEIASATAVATLPPKPTKPGAAVGIGSGKVKLTSSVTGSASITKWQYQKSEDGGNYGDWTDITSTSASLNHTLSGLTDGSKYKFKVKAENASGFGAVSDASDEAEPGATGLSAGTATAMGMTLTISNWSGNWHYQYTTPTGGSCSDTAVSGNTKAVTGLDSNTEYTFKAYSDNACESEIAAASAYATLPPKPAKPVVGENVGSGTLQLTSSVTGTASIIEWRYKKKKGHGNFDADWTAVTSTSTTFSRPVGSLANDSPYKFKVQARNASGWSAVSDESAAATPSAVSLTAGVASKDGMTLTLSGWSGKWYYKATTPAGSCSSSAVPADTASKAVASLDSNTTYTYAAYRDGSCSVLLATASAYATLPPKAAKPSATVNIGGGKVKLTSSVTGTASITKWQYKKKKDGGSYDANWSDISSTSTSLDHTVTGLVAGSAYQFKVRARNASGPGDDSDESDSATPNGASLGAGTATAAGMTLTIGRYSLAWHYKHTTPANGTCSATAVPAGTSTKAVTGLDSNTAYTFRAYSDGSCSNPLATAGAQLTKPGKPSKPAAAAGVGSGKLKLTATVTGSGTLSKWQYQQKSGGNFGAWQDISSTSTSLSHTVTGLTDGTSYQFKVRARNATGDGAESDTSDAAQPSAVTLTPSAVGTTKATLTIANFTESWHYKRTGPTEGSCAAAGSGTVVNLTGLTPDTGYTFKAYDDAACANAALAEASFQTNATQTTAPPADTHNDPDPVDDAPIDVVDTEPETTTATVPAAPSKPTVTSGNAQATLAWTSNGDGGSVITGWQYATDGDGYRDWTDIAGSGAGTTEHVVKGLANGTSYRFKVRAVNAEGAGPASPQSATVTPATTPAAPATFDAVSSNGQVTLTWAPGSDGGSAITGWQFAQDDGKGFGAWTNIQGSGADTSSHVVEGLTNGVAYRFKVRAVNALGAGMESPASGDAMPATMPDAPTKPEVLSGNAEVTLSWRSNGDGGSAIVSWQYAQRGGEGWGDWKTVPGSQAGTVSYVVAGLANGTAYRFKVRAVNGLGAGAESPASEAVTPATTPPAPSRPLVRADLTSFTLTWSSSGDGGSAITGWQYTTRNNGHWQAWTDIRGSGARTTSHKVRGLAKEVAHRFKVRAVNALGEGEESPVSSAVILLDGKPEFATGIDDLSLQRNVGMAPVVLPAASGGDGVLRYALQPALPPGLVFDAASRTLYGTPAQESRSQTYRYSVTDSDLRSPDRAELTFAIEVVTSAADHAVMREAAAAQGRALLSSVTGVIGERVRGGASAPASVWPSSAPSAPPAEPTASRETSPDEIAFGEKAGEGQLLDAPATHGDPFEVSHPHDATSLRWYRTDPGEHSGPAAMKWAGVDGRATGIDQLWGRSFATRLKAKGGSGEAGPWTVWGAADLQRFDGRADDGSYGGDVRSLYLGMDAKFGESWFGGGALGRHTGDVDYRLGGDAQGRVSTDLTGFYPYLQTSLASGLEAWAFGGYATGKATDRRKGVAGPGEESDLSMAVAAAGLRQGLREWNGVQLAMVGGAGLLSLSAEDGTRLVNAFTADVHRGRLALEASLGLGAMSPYVQLGGRLDGGDGETGMGLEMVTGVRYTGERLDFEAKGRWLAAHAAAGHEEFGAMTRLTLNARPDGTGLQLRVLPRWGAAMGGGAFLGDSHDLLGTEMPIAGQAPAWTASRNRGLALESELGYALYVDRLKGLVTPTVAHGRDTIGPRTRIGLDYLLTDPAKPSLNLKLDLGYELTNQPTSSGYRLQMTLTNQF